MIAAVEIAVVLDGQRLAADLAADAFLGAIAEHLGDDVLELVDEDLAVVAFEPDVPDLGEEIAPVVRVYRPVGDHRAGAARFGPG